MLWGRSEGGGERSYTLVYWMLTLAKILEISGSFIYTEDFNCITTKTPRRIKKASLFKILEWTVVNVSTIWYLCRSDNENWNLAKSKNVFWWLIIKYQYVGLIQINMKQIYAEVFGGVRLILMKPDKSLISFYTYM